jgi:hypothetical protein
LVILVTALPLGLEARAAVHGTISAGLEGNLSGLAAAIADHVKHLTLAATIAAVLGTTRSTARGATTGLILEALISIELLLGSGEHELSAALTAYQSLVFEHGKNPPNCMVPIRCMS